MTELEKFNLMLQGGYNPMGGGINTNQMNDFIAAGYRKPFDNKPVMQNLFNTQQFSQGVENKKQENQRLKNQQLGNFLLAFSDTLRGVNPAQGVLQRQEIFQQQADERIAEEANANFLKLIEGTPYATLANAIGVDATRRVYGDQTIKELNAEPKTYEPNQFFRNDTDEEIVFMDKIIAPGAIAGFDFSGESSGISIPKGLVSTKTSLPVAQSNALAIADLYSNKELMSNEQFNSQLAALGGVTGLDEQKFKGNLISGLVKQNEFGSPIYTIEQANQIANESWNLISKEAPSELKPQKEILVDGIKYLDTGKTTPDGKKIVSKDGTEFVLDE